MSLASSPVPANLTVADLLADPVRNPSFFVESYTTPHSKIMCSDIAYGFHIFGAYLITLVGIAALLVRTTPRLKFLHAHLGRAFLLIMFWLMSTSLLIYRTGLPRAILFFFVIAMSCLTIGYPAIRAHQTRFAARIIEHATELQAGEDGKSRTVAEYCEEARRGLLNRPRTWRERFFSLKALHGYTMTWAWYNMAGRTMVTDVSEWSGCNTYPAFKDPSGVVRLVPEIDPDYSFNTGEASFAIGVTLPAMLGFALFGIVWSVVAEKRQRAQAEAEMNSARGEADMQ